MKHNLRLNNRHSFRLRGFDCTQPGSYFLTICTKERACLFGAFVNGDLILNELGKTVQSVWNDLPNHYLQIQLDAFIVMPNHMHGIIFIVEQKSGGAGLKPAPTNSTNSKPATTKGPKNGLSEIVRGFKTFLARTINSKRGTLGAMVWQRNFFEHIIRNEDSLNSIRNYTLDNPARWAIDQNNSKCLIAQSEEPWCS